jgi:Predicted nucleic-acid-binding protein containing a Zn-ribbon
MSYEKEINLDKLISYPSIMETEEYKYTTGYLSEQFFLKLKNEAQLYAAYCKNCDLIFFPVRGFCLKCGNEVKELKKIKNEGIVVSYTIAKIDSYGKELEKPKIIALISFENVKGYLIHFLDEIQYDKLRIGLKVIPVFKEYNERNGSLTDIKYFKPAEN